MKRLASLTITCLLTAKCGSMAFQQNIVHSSAGKTFLEYCLADRNISYNKTTDISSSVYIISAHFQRMIDENGNFIGWDCNDIWQTLSSPKTTSLSLIQSGIRDLQVLNFLSNIQTLDLSLNNIEEIYPLSTLNNLVDLGLNDNKIKDIESIKVLGKLENLHLSGNKLENISALTKLQQLKSLKIAQNKISDIAPLANLIKLEELNINFNEISDLSPLIPLKNLKKLDFYYNPIYPDEAHCPTKLGPAVLRDWCKLIIDEYHSKTDF